jgi:hypothetical protein
MILVPIRKFCTFRPKGKYQLQIYNCMYQLNVSSSCIVVPVQRIRIQQQQQRSIAQSTIHNVNKIVIQPKYCYQLQQPKQQRIQEFSLSVSGGVGKQDHPNNNNNNNDNDDDPTVATVSTATSSTKSNNTDTTNNNNNTNTSTFNSILLLQQKQQDPNHNNNSNCNNNPSFKVTRVSYTNPIMYDFLLKKMHISV